jgi:two-component sensor histidine kinase
MPYQQDEALIESAPGPSRRESEVPFLLQWGMTLVALAVVVVLIDEARLPPSPMAMIIAYTAGALVVVIAVVQAVRHLRWERQTHDRRMAALELLIKMTAAVGPQMGTETRTLQHLPESIRALLGMKMSCVGLLEEEGRIFRVVASSGIEPPMLERRIPLSELPTTSRCVREKYVVTTADTQHSTVPVNTGLARELNFASMVHIPMIYQGLVMGVIVLGHDHKREFSQLEVRRAWLWGSHAAVMLAHSRLYAQMRDSLIEQHRLMEQRNALYDLNTAIQRPGTLEDILHRVVELAPGTLEVDCAVIWLITDDNPDEWAVHAGTAPYGSKIAGLRLRISGSRSGVVVTERRPLVIEDAFADTQLNPNLKNALGFRSLLFEPLQRGDGQVMGTMVLSRHKVGPFSSNQLELARMFSSRVAAVIEMTRLHHQTVSDAEAKAILLRELNHRVKNNLSAIITLLSLHRPPLAADARRWLDRAIERIGAMAQAHDLFSIGADRVTLQELVDRTVQSLSVVKPVSVTVKTDLAAGGARLRTDRAVKLAMAMHELCFNGITHGLQDKGTLTIRARRNNGQLLLEVEDDDGDGKPAPAPIEPAQAQGAGRLGLSLVRGLVSRELGGSFNLAPGPGGSVATVEFPLLADEVGESQL